MHIARCAIIAEILNVAQLTSYIDFKEQKYVICIHLIIRAYIYIYNATINVKTN